MNSSKTALFPSPMPRQLDIERNHASGFKFPPIDSSKQQIRLIQVIPSAEESLIKCKFVIGTVDVDPPLSYTALSYTWGAATLSQDIDTIVLHGQIFWVRKNLWTFLDYERLHSRQTLFWIDACSINQTESDRESILEKNHQVILMRHIYHRAVEVVIWLGKPPLDLEWQLDHLRAFLKSSWYGGVVHPKYDACDIQAFTYLWSKPYWRRVWIVQEILVAQKISLQCGKYEFEWHWFLQFYEGIHREDKSTLSRRPMFNGVNILLRPASTLPDIYPNFFQYNNLNLLDFTIEHIVVQFRNQECSNALDKIYGFLGLLNDPTIKPDYSRTMTELYEVIMRYGVDVIRKEGDCYPGHIIRIARLRHYLRDTLRLASETVRIVDTRLEAEININCTTLDEISVFLYSEGQPEGDSEP